VSKLSPICAIRVIRGHNFGIPFELGGQPKEKHGNLADAVFVET
jgi:hypothetical protein